MKSKQPAMKAGETNEPEHKAMKAGKKTPKEDGSDTMWRKLNFHISTWLYIDRLYTQKEI